jgi:hypothetical protein
MLLAVERGDARVAQLDVLDDGRQPGVLERSGRRLRRKPTRLQVSEQLPQTHLDERAAPAVKLGELAERGGVRRQGVRMALKFGGGAI